MGKPEYFDIVVRGGSILDVQEGEMLDADVAISSGAIASVIDRPGGTTPRGRRTIDAHGRYVAPGFWDPHLHTESTMLNPVELTRAVLPRGTTAIVTDPHEIANVLGSRGIRLLYRISEGLPVKFFFMVSSCVPAAPGLDTAGAELGPEDVDRLLELPRVLGLAEVMNIPAVLNREEYVMRMIRSALSRGKVVDGHAPRLLGADLERYAGAGIMSDHESVDGEEALEKLRVGLHVMVREGSAAKNLSPIVRAILASSTGFDKCMLATDDITPTGLLGKGHIDYLIRRAIEDGVDPLVAFKMATLNPARYFRVDGRFGSISPGKVADLVVLGSLEKVEVETVIANGKIAARNGNILERLPPPRFPNYATATMHVKKRIEAKDFMIHTAIAATEVKVRVIGAIDGQIVTRKLEATLPVKGTIVQPSVEDDVLQIAVVERHKRTGNIGLGFVSGFGLKAGAIASTVAHDSHNIIIVGASWEDMAYAVNELVRAGGGFIAVREGRRLGMVNLPVAGLISTERAESVSKSLIQLHEVVKDIGGRLEEPFMTLSFLALPVIPELKLTDKGLVDVTQYKFAEVIIRDH